MSSKTIYLLRHASAHNDISSDDFSRSLSEYGLQQATELGETLRSRSILPDKVYCSKAVRTQQTFEKLDLGVSSENITLSPDLYNANESTYYDFITMTDESINSILIVGHNPGIFGTALSLMKDQTSTDLFSYEPCTFSIFVNDNIAWDSVSKRSFACQELILPE